MANDQSGQRRMGWNVVTSWGGHLVFVVAGFVLPPFIDRHVGQASLGIWDFSWSLISYFGLAGLGIGSSVSRYVAKYRAAGELEKLNRVVSSVMAAQLAISVAVMLLTATAVWTLPHFFGARLGNLLPDARWVVALLGASLAVQMAFDTSRGVITGCHRWDLHNIINSGSYALTVVGMIMTLSIGGGLRGISVVYLAVTTATEIGRSLLAHRICQGLSRGFRYANWSEARRMFRFGIKSVVAGLPPLILAQGTSLLVGRALGPAALAVLTRPGNLMRSAQTFVNKFAFVLTPVAGSLQGAGRMAEVRDLLIRASRFNAFLVLPLTLMLTVMGDLLLQVWMGSQYAAGRVMAILAIGYFLPMTQQPVMTILAGLNMHGPIGLFSLAVSVLGFATGAVFFTLQGWSLEGAALLMSVPLAIANGIGISVYACRRLGIPLRQYLWRVYGTSTLCCLPFLVCLLVVRSRMKDHPLGAVLTGAFCGGLILLPIYWRFMLTEQIRASIFQTAGRGYSRVGSLLRGNQR